MNTKTTLADRLETADCRKDEKARRVLNVAPDTVADISAEELENGVTLERLDALCVPVLRYATQITIHGKIGAFDENVRPGGYRAVFRNGNGSIGVRYSAIDAPKKAILVRCSRASGSPWHTVANSSGFQVQRSFYVRNESERQAQKEATINALRAFPVARFYGSAFAFPLAYGLGYGVAAEIGAIPAAELWPLCGEVFGVASLVELETLEAAKQAEQAEKDRQWRAECDARKAESDAQAQAQATRFAAFLPTVQGVRLGSVERKAQTFLRYSARLESATVQGTFEPLRITVAQRGSRLCYSIHTKPGKWCAVEDRKWDLWNEAAKRGELLADPASAPKQSTGDAANTGDARKGSAKDENGPASPRQTFALFCATGKDWRKTSGLTYGKVSAALSAVQHLRGNKPAALAIVAEMLG